MFLGGVELGKVRMALGGVSKGRGGSALSAFPGQFYAKLSLLRSEAFLAYSEVLLTRFSTISEALAARNKEFIRIYGAEEGTRTPTPLRVRGPEPRASANSATSAQYASPALR